MGRTISDWLISIGEVAGGYALWQYADYHFNRAIMSKIAPLSAWSAGIYVTHKVGQTISQVVDPEHGKERWNEYIVDPMGSIDKTRSNLLQSAVNYAAIRDHMHEQYGFPMPSLWLHRV